MSKSFASIDAFLSELSSIETRVRSAQRRGMEEAGRMLESKARDMIGQETEDWPALADTTVARKEALGQTGRISGTDPLFATGELRATIGHQVEGHSAIILGSPDPVAPYHEHGTEKMPPRPFIGPTMLHHGHEAAHLVANHVMGAVAGKNGPLKPTSGVSE